MLKLRTTRPFAGLLLVGLLGCRDVKPIDITGTWIMTRETRQRLPLTQQKTRAAIILDSNGTFAVSDVPEDLLYDPPDVADGLVTGSGVWKLISLEGEQQIQLDFHAIVKGKRGTHGLPYGTQLDISKGWSTTRLFYFQGDPDDVRKVTFERE
jgi:hypothetical protein